MSTQMPSDQPTKWLGLPVIATIARLLCRELTLQNEYLSLENKILKSKIKGRIRFTDDERRSLVDAALAMGKQLMESVVNIVKPATLLAWQRHLEKEKWDYSEKRKRRQGRPRTPANIEALICQLARENIWGYKKIQGELKKLVTFPRSSCIFIGIVTAGFIYVPAILVIIVKWLFEIG